MPGCTVVTEEEFVMIIIAPEPRPLLRRNSLPKDIFKDREEAMEEYRRRVHSAIEGKKTEKA